MILFKKADDLRNYLVTEVKKNKKIGFVPTMGALHEGHVSLLRSSLKNQDSTVCSIFVNPAQFNNKDDFEKYPLTIEKDINLLEETGCPLLFLPSVKEIYPDGFSGKPNYDLGHLDQILEGKYRPGHFQGVCLVMHRLLEIVRPGFLYMGQKDYQQCMVIKKLIQLIGMNEQTELVLCPTVREHDGLAMSSRNLRLDAGQRKRATGIFACLNYIKNNLGKVELSKLKMSAVHQLEGDGFKPDYVSIATAENLEEVERIDINEKLVVLIAAYLDDIRLIDNMIL